MLICISAGIKAQTREKVEFQLEIGGGTGAHNVTNYHFHFSSGYEINDKVSLGTGTGYVNYFNRTDLKGDLEDRYIETGNHGAWRPFLYGKYNMLPKKKINPFIGVKLGYALFSNTTFAYVFDKDRDPFGNSDVDDQNLGIKGGINTIIDMGISRCIGHCGAKFHISISYDLQPVTYHYLSNKVKKNISSFGANIGITF